MNNLRAIPLPLQWHAGLPIYASEAFLKSVGDEYGWLGGTNDQAELCCALPYTVTRKFGLRMVRFRTAIIPLLDELGIEEEKTFLNSVVDYFRSSGADIILPSGNAAIFRTYPDGASAAPYGTFINDLSQPEEVLRNNIRKTYRHNIRKAEAAGVEVSCGLKYLDASYQLVAETLRRSGATFRSYNEFKRRILGLGESVKIFIAEHRGVAQGCVVSPFSLHTAYNCYAGSKAEPILGAMHLLHWEVIRHFHAMGVKLFDFQGVRINPEKGSKQEGIMTYKQGFGGKLVRGYSWKYALRPLKSMRYSIPIRVFKGGDIVDRERHKLARE